MKKPKIIKLISFVLGLSLLWILGVDRSWFVKSCDDCFWSKDVFQYRLFGISILEREIEHISPISYVANNLGVPCKHQHLQNWHKQRRWGLLFCCYPNMRGTTRLIWNKDIYNEGTREKLRLLLKSNPTLPEQFQQRVLFEHDLKYWERFRKELLSEREND
jgi:hypothetical protein